MMMSEEDRTLKAMHPNLIATYDDTANVWTNLNGWNVDGSLIWHETALDLSGYAMQSLTIFPEAVGIQDPGTYLFKAGVASPYSAIHVLDIITSVPMDIPQVSADIVNNIGPALLGSLYEYETIIFGSYRFFTLNQNIPYPNYQQLERSVRFDSGEPNASDKLFCYRIVRTLQTDLDDDSTLTIPATRQLVSVKLEEESELVYMQRLKRSYELANQV